nr:hypothetical protein [Tanacetum cinerariifolium]
LGLYHVAELDEEGINIYFEGEEDGVEPGVILGRSFMRLAKGIVNFGNGVITIYLEPDPFEDDLQKTEKSPDDWDQLLDFNFDDVPKFREELPPLVCKMGKSNRNKKRQMENLSSFYQDIRPSLLAGDHLTQEEAAKEALAMRISQKFALLEEERHVIKTMAYHDKYKKILDEIWKDKVELDGKIIKEEDEAVKRIKVLRAIHKIITYGSCQKMTGYDKIQKNDLWLLSMLHAKHRNGYANVAWLIARWMKRKGAGSQKESQFFCGQFISKIARMSRVLTDDVLRSLSAPVYCTDLDTTTLRELIDSKSRLIPEDP